MIIVLSLLLLAIRVYWWLIVAYVILTWVPRGRGEPPWLYNVREFLEAVTEPYLSIFRRIIPSVGAGGVGIDFSPLVALIVLNVLQAVIVNLFAGVLT
jgi:YggT family protein